jgi:hypothetical protein
MDESALDEGALSFGHSCSHAGRSSRILAEWARSTIDSQRLANWASGAVGLHGLIPTRAANVR